MIAAVSAAHSTMLFMGTSSSYAQRPLKKVPSSSPASLLVHSYIDRDATISVIFTACRGSPRRTPARPRPLSSHALKHEPLARAKSARSKGVR